jgi:stress response protein SCP2
LQLQKGANAPLPKGSFKARISYARLPAGLDVDVSAYLLTSTGKVRGDSDMVFYNQATDADGSVSLDVPSGTMRVNPASVPAAIERIAVCVVVDGGRASTLGAITIAVEAGPSFIHDVSASQEAAIIVAEFYRRNGEWKMRAVGQGFAGGLAPLARSFGMDVEGDSAKEDPKPAPKAPVADLAPAAPKLAPVSLTKVTLAKSGKVDLRKGAGAIRAKLIWEGRRKGEGDLDLYCFYVLKDGTCGKVYWKDLGRAHAAPWITLSGDSRRAGEEEIVLHKPERLRYALFAAYSAVANGTGSFQSYRTRMVLTDHDGSEVTIPLLNPNDVSYWVAISHVTVGANIRIEHVETYGKSGLRAFIAAERSPRLHPDGSWDISKGPVEFKRK